MKKIFISLIMLLAFTTASWAHGGQGHGLGGMAMMGQGHGGMAMMGQGHGDAGSGMMGYVGKMMGYFAGMMSGNSGSMEQGMGGFAPSPDMMGSGMNIMGGSSDPFPKGLFNSFEGIKSRLFSNGATMY